MDILSTRLIEAIRFAALKHKKQRRKDVEKTPYINHPIEVVYVLALEGGVCDEDILIAAALHDVIEDTKTTYAELTASFGAEVTEYVREVSDDKELKADVRKELQITHAPHLSVGAGLIKIADKLSNMRDIAANSPVGWNWQRRVNYFKWAALVVGAIPHGSELRVVFYKTFWTGLDVIAAQAKVESPELFVEVPEHLHRGTYLLKMLES